MRITICITVAVVIVVMIGIAKYKTGLNYERTPYEQCIDTSNNMRSDRETLDYQKNVCDKLST